MAQQAALSRGTSWGAGDHEAVSAASATARSRTRLKELEEGIGKSSSEIRRVEAEIRSSSANLEKLRQQQQKKRLEEGENEVEEKEREDEGGAQSSSLENVTGPQTVEAEAESEAGVVTGTNQKDEEKKDDAEEVATTPGDEELRGSKGGGREAAAQKAEILRTQESLDKKRVEMEFLLEQHGALTDLITEEKKRIQAAGEMDSEEESKQQSAAAQGGTKSLTEDAGRLWRLIEGLNDQNAEKRPQPHPHQQQQQQQQLRQTQSLPRQQKPRVYHDISSLRSRNLARNAQNGVRSANIGRSASVGVPPSPASSPIASSPTPGISGGGGGGGGRVGGSNTGSGNGRIGNEPPPLGAAEFVERQGSGNRKRQKSSTFELEKEKHREHLRALSTKSTGSSCRRHIDHEAKEKEKEKRRSPLDKLSSRTSSTGSTTGNSSSIGKGTANKDGIPPPPPPRPLLASASISVSASAAAAVSVSDGSEDASQAIIASAASESSSSSTATTSSSPLLEQQQPSSASPASSIGSSEMSTEFGLPAAAVDDGKSHPDVAPPAAASSQSSVPVSYSEMSAKKTNNDPDADSDISENSAPAAAPAAEGLAGGDEAPTGKLVQGSGDLSLEVPGLMEEVESEETTSSVLTKEEEVCPSPPAEHGGGGGVANDEVKNEQEEEQEQEQEQERERGQEEEEEKKEDGVQMWSDGLPSPVGDENEENIVESAPPQGAEEEEDSPAKESVSSPEEEAEEREQEQEQEQEDKGGVQWRGGDDDVGHDEEESVTAEDRPPVKEEEKSDITAFASGGEEMPEPAAPSVVPPMSFRDKLLAQRDEVEGGGAEGSPSTVTSVHETLEPPLDEDDDDVLQGEPLETAVEGEEEAPVPLGNEASDDVPVIASPSEAEHPGPVVAAAEEEGAGEQVEESDASAGRGSFGDREEEEGAAESSTRREGSIVKPYANEEEEIDIPEGDIDDIEVAETADDSRQLLRALKSQAGNAKSNGEDAPKEKWPESSSSSNEDPVGPLDNGTTTHLGAESLQPQQNGLEADEANTNELDKFPEEEPQTQGEEAAIPESSGEGRNWRQEAENQMVQLSSQLSLLQKQVEEEVDLQEKSKSDSGKDQTSTERENFLKQVSSFADEVRGMRQNIDEIQGILYREGGDVGNAEHWARDLQSKCADQSVQLEHLGKQVSTMAADLKHHLELRADIDGKLGKQVEDRQKTEGQLTGLSEALAHTVTTIEEKEEAVGELVLQQRHLLVDQLREAEKLRNIAEVRVGTLNRQIEQLELVCDQAQNFQAVSKYQDKALRYGLQAFVQLFLLAAVLASLYSRVAQPLRGSIVPT